MAWEKPSHECIIWIARRRPASDNYLALGQRRVKHLVVRCRPPVDRNWASRRVALAARSYDAQPAEVIGLRLASTDQSP